MGMRRRGRRKRRRASPLARPVVLSMARRADRVGRARPRCDANAATPVRGFHPRGARTVDVGRTGSGTNRYRHHTLARPGPEESYRSGDNLSDSSRRLLQRQAVHDFCVVDNVLELAAARGRTSWCSNSHRERRCRSKVRPLIWSGDFDAAADRQALDVKGTLRIASWQPKPAADFGNRLLRRAMGSAAIRAPWYGA